ncbi:hypothetical protein Hbal_2812 [Hirschia baltica ATCC 49814]|uniref:Uncharacterized protein n=1 Tax=Hirschia baltica (strain ATCC 49814 / DSM 5838 / IFAM 1418) TaxID=582402 RepID=C6XQI6_HIRBI|nr:hypothetical protein Hbal_2812 [Hirschia baltica ATCC 49814]
MSGANYPNPVRSARLALLENVVGVFSNIAQSEGGNLDRLARVFRAHIVELVAEKCVSAMMCTKISNRFQYVEQ